MGLTAFRYSINLVFLIIILPLLVLCLLTDSKQNLSVISTDNAAQLEQFNALLLESVSAIEWSPDGNLLAVSTSNQIQIYAISSQEIVVKAILQGHNEQVNDLSFSPDGQLLASASSDTTIVLWDLHTKQISHVLQEPDAFEVWSVSFSPDGEMIASGSSRYHNSGALRLWDVETGNEISILQEDVNNSDNALAFNSEGVLASIENEDEIILRNIQADSNPQILTGNTNYISDITFSSDGKTLASAGWDRIIRVWNIEAGAEVFTSSEQDAIVNAVSFNQDGSVLASASSSSITVWDVERGQKIGILDSTSIIVMVRFNPTGTILASVGQNSVIHFWRVPTAD